MSDPLRPLSVGNGTNPAESSRVEAERAAREGDNLHAAGRFKEARERFAAAIQLAPGRADYHLRLAVSAWAEGARTLVDPHLREAVRLRPDWATAHEALSQSLLEYGQIDLALSHARSAAELAPNDPSVKTSLAFVLEQAAQPQAAWEIVSTLVSSGIEHARLATLYARMAPDYEQTEQALKMALRLLAARRGTPRDASDLHFAAAPLLERLGQFDDAFAHITQANLLRGAHYDPAPDQMLVERQIAYFTRARVAALPRATLDSSPVVLVVGMPRSGTSLVEQILASHPDVNGAGELPYLISIAASVGINVLPTASAATNLIFPQSVDRLTPDQANALAAQYLGPVRERWPAPRVVDKMPLNLHCLGLAAAILPRARIIWCRRDPMDTCLSCYFTNFGTGNEFSFDLRDAGLYHSLCDQLMSHWQSVLDLPILEMRYEDLVTDPAAHARRMVDFIDLPWDDRCSRPHETRRPVSTASAQQVRRPIYQSSIGRWRHYERHLNGLNAALANKVR